MLFVSLRDLQWRRRRFIIGVVATGLVFALALLISGISQSFINEVARTVEAFEADEWVVSEEATGPFTSASLLEQAGVVEAVRSQPGVEDAQPVLMARFTVDTPDTLDIGVMGIEPGGVGTPDVKKGRALTSSNEVVVDGALDVGVGEKLNIGGTNFDVVGTTSGVTYFAGQPVVFATLETTQQLMIKGAPYVTAVLVRGRVDSPPPGTHVLDNDEVISDLRRPLESATGTIDIIRLLLWIVAAGIIGSVLYLQAIERTRDFAVFKATGVTGRGLAGGLAFQAIVLAVASALVAIVLAFLLSPIMQMRVEIPTSALLSLPIVAVVIGVIASLFGLRRAVSVDPALAFGG